MFKAFLLSIVVLTFVLPAYAARTRDPARGLTSLVGMMLLAEATYCAILYLVF